jgi:hypothetical protein
MSLTRKTAGLAGMLAAGLAWPLPGHAESIVRSPAPLSADVIAGIGNKKECITPARMLLQLHAEQVAHGGRTLALVDGANQNFSDTWRGLAGEKPAEVSLVLAQGYRQPLSGEAVKVVEFNRDGCAFSQTTIASDDWNVILGAVVRGPALAI